MKTKLATLSIILLFMSTNLFAQKRFGKYNIFYVNSPNWIQTKGPPGGYINDLAIDPNNPMIIYAVGPSEGIYKSTDSGYNWNLIKFPKLCNVYNIEIDSQNPSNLYCDYQNLSR